MKVMNAARRSSSRRSMTKEELEDGAAPSKKSSKKRNRKKKGADAIVGQRMDDIGTDWVPTEVPKAAKTRRLILDVLDNLTIFQELSPSQKESIMLCMTEARVPTGQDLIRQGDTGNAFYIVSRPARADGLFERETRLPDHRPCAGRERTLQHLRQREAGRDLGGGRVVWGTRAGHGPATRRDGHGRGGLALLAARPRAVSEARDPRGHPTRRFSFFCGGVWRRRVRLDHLGDNVVSECRTRAGSWPLLPEASSRRSPTG